MVLVIAILLNITSLLTPPYRTETLPNSGVATIRVLVDGQENVEPVVALDNLTPITITFDDLSYVPKNYYYRIVHCDALWMPSDLLQSMDYIEGMDDISIDDYETSQNTAFNYIHYSFTIPDDNLTLKLSGNYAVLIARDNDFDNQLVAVACFSMVDSKVSFNALYSPTTLRGINSQWQQVEVNANIGHTGSANPLNDFKLVVRQNRRRDNQVVITQPTYVNGDILYYKNLSVLTFEAGNQYRTIDFSSRYTYGAGIDRFVFTDSVYTVLLDPDLFNRSRRTDAIDAHGAYIIHIQGDYDDNTEADYVWVRFVVPTDNPFFDGRVFLLSEATYDILDSRSLMSYDATLHSYTLSLFLKQGGLNYQYIFVPKGGEPSLGQTEGNYWQTNNSYQFYLYYHPYGERYDRLVGFAEI